MPSNVTQSQGPLQSLKINDFTAGIVSFANASQTTYRVPNIGPKISFSTHTYGCYGLPNGGLLFGPTPFFTDSPTLNLAVGSESPTISGYVKGDGYLNGDYQSWITVRATNAAGHIISSVYEFSAAQAPTNALLATTIAEAYTTNFLTYPFITTMTDGTGYFNDITWTEYIGVGGSSITYYSGQEASSSYSMPSGVNGIAVPANGRVWYMAEALGAALPILNVFDYTAPTIAGSGDNHAFNGAVTLIDYDNPGSFGGWGCISSANSLLVKTNGGGILTTGDIFNPTISRAPSVQGTNGLIGNACQTPLGLVYRSNNRGVWVWSGDTNATKLSQNINDYDFNSSYYAGHIQYTAPIYTGVPNSIYNIQYICNMIFVDGGLFFDPVTNAWWNLPPYLTNSNADVGQTSPIFFAETVASYGSFQTFWFGTPGNITTFNAAYYSFDVSAPTSKSATYAIVPPSGYYGSYIETNPIQLGDEILEVQQISLVVQGTGTLTVNCLGVAGNVLTAKTVNVVNSTFSRINMNVDFLTDVLVLQIGWTNSESAGVSTPILESVEIRYQPGRYPVKIAN